MLRLTGFRVGRPRASAEDPSRASMTWSEGRAVEPIVTTTPPTAALRARWRLVHRVVCVVVLARDHWRVPAGAARADPWIRVGARRLLVVLLFDVDTPDVVTRAGRDVLSREHRRVHRVVLVV